MLYMQNDLPCTNQSFTEVAETDCLHTKKHRWNLHILVMKANIPSRHMHVPTSMYSVRSKL